VAEKALDSVSRKGFIVHGLTLDEARNIYPIRGMLDPEALRLSGLPGPESLERLEELNHQLRNATDARSAIDLDEAWHRELWAECPNPVLIELIEQFMRRTRRYELASMGQHRIIDRTTRTKAGIVESLRAGALERACSQLRSSLMSGGEPVFQWLAQRDSDESQEA